MMVMKQVPEDRQRVQYWSRSLLVLGSYVLIGWAWSWWVAIAALLIMSVAVEGQLKNVNGVAVRRTMAEMMASRSRYVGGLIVALVAGVASIATGHIAIGALWLIIVACAHFPVPCFRT
jgi:hypothetical protein